MIAATHIKTHRIAADGVKSTSTGRAIGKIRDGLNSKLLGCDGQGRPVHLRLAAGNRVDIIQARQCREGHLRKWQR